MRKEQINVRKRRRKECKVGEFGEEREGGKNGEMKEQGSGEDEPRNVRRNDRQEKK